MRNVWGVLTSALVCAVALGACGSTAESKRTAAINSALRRLQTDVEQERSKLTRRLAGNEHTLASLLLVSVIPPKGVTSAEWEAALMKDQPLQHALASASHYGPPRRRPSTADVERSTRRDIEAERQSPHPPQIKGRHNAIRSLGCREAKRGVWLCTIRFGEGLVVVERVTWYQSAGPEGVSVVSERMG
jgi:hypothetical protein